MQLIRTSTYGDLALGPREIADGRVPYLKGGAITGASGSFGSVQVQEYQSEQFMIRVVHGFFHKKTGITLPLPPAIVYIAFCLRGNGILKIGGKKITVHAGQHVLFTQGTEMLTVDVEKENGLVVLLLSYPEHALSHLLHYFPVLRGIIEGKKETKTLGRASWSNKFIETLIDQLFHAHYEDALLDFLYSEWVEDLLQQALLRSDIEPASINHLSSSDVEKIHRARVLILADLKRHHKIEELSRLVELNAFKIKEGFRQLFGMGPFSILQEARMELARQLLLETDRPEKDIMREAGYTSLTAFVKAFRNTYGIPPGHYRSRTNEN